MTLLYLVVALCIVSFLANNLIVSRKYKALTGHDLAAVRFQGLFTRSINDWTNDPVELDAFGKLSDSNQGAVISFKHESICRNCVTIALLIVAFLTPRFILHFPLIPSSMDQFVPLFFCLISMLIDFAFWNRWLRMTVNQNGKLALFSIPSIISFSIAIAVTIAWHLMVKWIF